MFDRKSRISRKSRHVWIPEIRDLRCLRSLCLSNPFVIPSFHNSLYNSLLNCFFEPIFHRPYAHSKDFRLLHGILFGQVRGKHLEELTLEHIAPYLTHRCGFQLRHNLEDHSRVHQQFVTHEQHCLEILFRTNNTLRRWFGHIESQACQCVNLCTKKNKNSKCKAL